MQLRGTWKEIRSIFIVKLVVDFRQSYVNIEKKKVIIPQT